MVWGTLTYDFKFPIYYITTRILQENQNSQDHYVFQQDKWAPVHATHKSKKFFS